MFLVLMAVNFLLIGPIMVGIPVLANQRLPEGATAFGLLMSAFAGGNFRRLPGARDELRRPGGAGMQRIVTLLLAGFRGGDWGAGGLITFTWSTFVLLFLLGLGNGYIAIILMTWMQTTHP